MNYPLTVNKKDGVTLTPHNSYYSDEYASKMCDLYLTARYTATSMERCRDTIALMRSTIIPSSRHWPTTSSVRNVVP